MKVLKILETNEYVLVNGFLELDYTNYSFSLKDVYLKELKDLTHLFECINPHNNDTGWLTYEPEEKQWYWDVFNKKRTGRKTMFDTIEYNDAKVVKRIKLKNLMK
jgi:hypothetical protein